MDTFCSSCGERVNVARRGYELFLNDVPKETFARINTIGVNNVNSLYICSPFLAPFKNQEWNSIITEIAKKKDFHLITLPYDQWEKQTARVMEFYVRTGAGVHFVRNLHAKMYLIGAGSQSFAVFGSPNFTNQASKNVELGIFVTDQDEYYNFERTFWRLVQKKEGWEQETNGMWKKL